LAGKITLEDLIRIYGEGILPKEIDRKILMKHFDISINRVIGKRSVDKVKQVLLNSIEAARAEQFKDRGGVIDSPVARLSSSITVKNGVSDGKEPEEDKYGLSSIRSGIVSKRLKGENTPQTQEKIEEDKETHSLDSALAEENSLNKEDDSALPSVEDLTVLSGGNLIREDVENGNSIGHVKREISIRNYTIQDENRSARWGKERIKDRKGALQEINHPAYIFHSDLWQLEAARESSADNRCDILQHVVLDMVANNINVVMLENESEPYFVVEGHGLLYSKDSLKDKINIHELIQLMIISCDAWQIALKRPESMIRGQDAFGKKGLHAIDMTSVIPLADIRAKMVDIDNEFKACYDQPDSLMPKVLRILHNHRKNVIWTSGGNVIPSLRQTIKEHKNLIENPTHSLNVVIIGTQRAYHPMKIKYNLSGEISFEELLPGYCKKHSILSNNSMSNIFGSIPAIFDSEDHLSKISDFVKVTHAVYQRLGFSALESQFDPGYHKGNPSEVMPISNLDIILPLLDTDMQQKLEKKGFKID